MGITNQKVILVHPERMIHMEAASLLESIFLLLTGYIFLVMPGHTLIALNQKKKVAPAPQKPKVLTLALPLLPVYRMLLQKVFTLKPGLTLSSTPGIQQENRHRVLPKIKIPLLLPAFYSTTPHRYILGFAS